MPAKCRDLVPPRSGAWVGGTRFPGTRFPSTKLPDKRSWQKVASTKFGAQPRTVFMDSMVCTRLPLSPPNNKKIYMCLVIIGGGRSTHLPPLPIKDYGNTYVCRSSRLVILEIAKHPPPHSQTRTMEMLGLRKMIMGCGGKSRFPNVNRAGG